MHPWMYTLICLLLHLELTAGTTVTVNSAASCGSEVISTYSSLYIYYNGDDLYSPCTIHISGGSAGKEICFDTTSYSQDNCGFNSFPKSSFKISFYEGSSLSIIPDKTFGCNDGLIYTGKEWCTTRTTATISLEGRNVGDTNLNMKVYLKDDWGSTSDWGSTVKSTVLGVTVIIGIVIGGIVLVIIVIIVLACYCCNRRRGSAGAVYRSPQAQQTVTTVPPPAPTYPAAPGAYPAPTMQPGYPAQGFQPPQTGYQPPPAGYQPQAAGYQPAPVGHQPQAAGYQPPPAGYQQQQYQTTQYEKPAASAPPQEGEKDAPPPYPGI